MIKNLHSHTFLGPSYCDLVWVEITPNGDKFDVGWMYRGKETPFEQKSLKFSDVKKIVKGYQWLIGLYYNSTPFHDPQEWND